MKSNKKYNYVGFLYILPWIVGFFVFQFTPLLESFWYSFTDLNLLGGKKFIGLANYAKAFSSPEFWNSLKVTFFYVFMAVPMKVAFALFVAMLLNQKIKGIGIFRTVYYMPSILGGSVAISILWKYLFMKEGVINNIIGKFGIEGPDWLGSSSTALFTIALVTVWQFGSSMLLFLAGLKNIPKYLYEAADIDGASRWMKFWKITIPELSPIVLFNIVMQMINAFQEFTPAYVITRGGPLKSTNLLGLMLYEQGFTYFKMGYASALSWILFTIILIFTGLTFRSSQSWVHYGDSL